MLCQPGAPESGNPGRVGTKQGSRGLGAHGAGVGRGARGARPWPPAHGRTQVEKGRAELPPSRLHLRGGGRKRRTREGCSSGFGERCFRRQRCRRRFRAMAALGRQVSCRRVPGLLASRGGVRVPTWCGIPTFGALRRVGAVLARCPPPPPPALGRTRGWTTDGATGEAGAPSGRAWLRARARRPRALGRLWDAS